MEAEHLAENPFWIFILLSQAVTDFCLLDFLRPTQSAQGGHQPSRLRTWGIEHFSYIAEIEKATTKSYSLDRHY